MEEMQQNQNYDDSSNVLSAYIEGLGHLFYCDEKCQRQFYLYDVYLSMILLLFSWAFSFYWTYRHCQNYTNRYFQEKIIVILFMAPVYAICSCLSIINPQTAEFLVLIRDIYESLILFCFFYLIFAYLAYDKQQNKIIDVKVYQILVQQHEVHHLWPINYCQKPYRLSDPAKGKYFAYRCKKYILQFLVIKPGGAFLLIILQFFRPAPWAEEIVGIVGWIICISISLSLYYLVLFYHVLKDPLAPYSPLLKFLTVKITLFFTFWQQFALGYIGEIILQNFDQTAPGFNKEHIIQQIANSLISIEMLVLAIAGGIAYSYKEFIPKEGEQKINVTFKSVIQGNWESFKNDFRLIKPKKFGFTGQQQTSEEKRLPSRPSVLQKHQSFTIELQDRTQNLYETLIIPNYI